MEQISSELSTWHFYSLNHLFFTNHPDDLKILEACALYECTIHTLSIMLHKDFSTVYRRVQNLVETRMLEHHAKFAQVKNRRVAHTYTTNYILTCPHNLVPSRIITIILSNIEDGTDTVKTALSDYSRSHGFVLKKALRPYMNADMTEIVVFPTKHLYALVVEETRARPQYGNNGISQPYTIKPNGEIIYEDIDNLS